MFAAWTAARSAAEQGRSLRLVSGQNWGFAILILALLLGNLAGLNQRRIPVSPFSSGLPGVLQDAGLVPGLFMSLTIGSYLIRDTISWRGLGQYVLIGAGLGYLAVLVWAQRTVAPASLRL